MIYTQPDSFTYSKTGMLFGAELVSKSTDFLSRNPEIANLFQDYVQNCVMGDIYLNHKYTLEELMASSDPYTLIFSRPSPLRGVYDSNNNFVTCKDASVSLKDKLNLDTQSGGKTWHYYAQQLFGGRPDPNLLFSTLIGDSYRYFYDSSKSASQIIRQNVTINALKEGITSYAARNGDSASLVNLATTSSMEKQRLAHVSIGHVAMRTLPMTQTILTGIAIGIFPLLVLAAVFNKLTLSVLKGYVFALMWLQSWPMLYAILNSAMTFYAKQNGAPVVLSEISQIQLKYSDLASTAGYLSMMIPPLSWMMVRGLGAGFSSVYSHFASSAISPTASAAGSVVDGNYSYGNMQTENVNGFSWSTNSTTSFGQMMYQTGSGATATQTRDGNMVMDASGAMSRLPVGINATRQIAAAQQEMAREASNRAESALHGFSSSIASAWNSLSQFGSNRGSSDSVTGGADSTMSAQDSMMASRMRSAVESQLTDNPKDVARMLKKDGKDSDIRIGDLPINYYTDKDNYYVLGSMGERWAGRGAEQLGLQGSVDKDVFTRLLEGRLPDGADLSRMQDGSNKHRPGYDLTFSAPKSVSMMAMLGGDKRLIDAHNQAVDFAVRQVEALASTRVMTDGQSETVLTGNLVMALFNHDTSRDQEPQLHTHTVVANVTQHNGEWKTLSSDKVGKTGFIENVYANQIAFGRLYREKLKEQVEALGYETEVVGKHGMWEMPGVPVEAFSGRSQAIREAVGEDASLKSRDVAALDTRKSKQHVDPEVRMADGCCAGTC